MQWDQIKSDYSIYVFDCDGVILDSNQIKSNAFAESVKFYGDELVNKFVSYHQANGGITRQVKFEYFCRNILCLESWQKICSELLGNYSEIVKFQLSKANFIAGVVEILEELSRNGKVSFVVTGGSEMETKTVMQERGIDKHFKAILGNPISKHANMTSLKNKNYFNEKSFYFGDSKLDSELANEFSLDFLCIYGASEWCDIPVGINKAKDFLSIIECS